MITVFLVLAGLGLGSFINALVWRVHQQTKIAGSKKGKRKGSKGTSQYSVLRGRSMCVHCEHRLSTSDLIPLLSWLWLKGRCRYCKKPISWQYPAVELASALVFVGSYIFWPSDLQWNGEWLLFITWLLSSVGLIALVVYDLRWMLLPSRILYPTLLVASLGQGAYILLYEPRKLHALLLWAGSVLISSGIFWLMFQVSRGRWIGFGDVRLGLIIGTLLADPGRSAAMIFIASLLGTLAALPGLMSGKKTLSSKLPYGPFLIASTAIVVIFGDLILDWYKNLLGF